jgi:hypothetical protein
MRADRRACCAESGQASAEFLLLATLLVAGLLLPWLGGEPPALVLLTSIVGAMRSFSFWIAII